MPKDYHEDLGHGGKANPTPSKAGHEKLDDTERAKSQAGDGFKDAGDEYRQTGFGQAGYRAAKGSKAKARPRKAARARP